MPITIGVDVGGSHISSAAVNMETNSVVKATYFQGSVNNKASKEIIFKEWAKVINQTILAGGEQKIRIGFAMPGPFQYKNGVAMFHRNDKYEALYKISVASEFAAYLHHEEVRMRFINDAASFGVGASLNSKQSRKQKVMAITLGTGFGAAFLQENIPVVSSHNIPEGGNLWDQPFQSGIADDFFSTRWFLKRYKELAGDNTMQGVKDIVNHNNKITAQIFLEFANNFSEFLLPYLKKFDCDLLQIGGSITKSQDLFMPIILQNWKKRKFYIPITIINNTDKTNIVGSAHLFNNEFWESIQNRLPEC